MLLKKLEEVRNQQRAMLAANFYNLETCKAIVQAAVKLNSPVILQLTPGSIKYMGLKTALGTARNLSDDNGLETWVHLDQDFRPGWDEGVARSRELGLYRQPYCGCIFSERDRYLGPREELE